MASPATNQGTLNRIRASVIFSQFPGLSVTSSFLGRRGITITFTGGQLCDGLSSIVISDAYGWVKIFPVPGGSAWYVGE